MNRSERQVASPFRVMRDGQSYKNMLYLLISFPLGLTYFIVLVTGITLGLGTLIIWIGVLVLMLMIAAWEYMARFERQMAISWLHVTIPLMSHPSTPRKKLWQWFQAQVRSSLTWKSLIYLIVKFPFGCFTFVLLITLLSLNISLVIATCLLGLFIAPFVLLVVVLRDASLTGSGLWMRRYGLFLLMGCGLSLVTLYLSNGLAFLWGQFARLMLGMSDADWQVEEARALADQEQARAEQSERRRRELVVNVSHELRTPVASIAGHLESLLIATNEGTTMPPADTLYSYLMIAYREVENLGMLVDDLLALARMESDELRLDIGEVVASEVVEDVYQALMPLAARQRGVTLVRGSMPSLSPVLADRQRLMQVLLNLVRNAITSTPAGGIVSLSLEQADPQHLVLIVADSGIGIPAEALEHIFERFYRVDNSRARASGGFGLGLSIVRELVVAMGGSISVQSTVGQGSRFCVHLCIAGGAEASSALPKTAYVKKY